MSAEVWIVRAGLLPYEEARVAQKRLEAARQAGEIPDVLLLLEHPPVYTRGRRSEPAELPMGVEWYERQGIEVRDTDRGGRVTYHGPGQLVGYPIMDLDPARDRDTPGGGAEGVARVDVVQYIRRMEEVVIGALGEHGVEAGIIEGLTGVWTRPADPPPGGSARKVASIGVHVSRGVTTHGFAINVNNDLQPFEWIVPCGIDGCHVTSLARELRAEQDIDAFAGTVAERFASVYDRVPAEPDPGLLEKEPGAALHSFS